MKEHTIIVVMANASFAGGAAYATDILLAQEVFYGQYFGWVRPLSTLPKFLLTISRVFNYFCASLLK